MKKIKRFMIRHRLEFARDMRTSCYEGLTSKEGRTDLIMIEEGGMFRDGVREVDKRDALAF